MTDHHRAGKDTITEEKKKTLAQAPTSMREGDVVHTGVGVSIDYTYKPQLGDMPSLDLPEVSKASPG